MSQFARQLDVREPYRKQRVHTPEVPLSPRKRITKGEKFLWSLGIVVILVLSIFIVSMQANLYVVNHKMNKIQTTIDKVSNENKKLGIEQTKLMDPKRIMEYAQKHGFTLNIDNVKVIK